MESAQPYRSYLRVASANPEVYIGDVETNVANILSFYEDASKASADIIAFPELCITGYSLGDLVQQNQLLESASLGLKILALHTQNSPTTMVVGLPLSVDDRLYNCAAVVAGGSITGIVPKSYLPNYNEFYEQRWYTDASHCNATSVVLHGIEVPFGIDLLFEIRNAKVGVEICEDLWVPDPPSRTLAEQGALVVVNPSASPERIGKAVFRKQLVAMQSARCALGYIYSSAHQSESTADTVMSGHSIIAEAGSILAERLPFSDSSILMHDIDTDHLRHERRQIGYASVASQARLITITKAPEATDLIRTIDPHPFIPPEGPDRDKRMEEILSIQANALAMRMKNTHQNRIVLGLSGGLDSTLALLVACKAATILGKDLKDTIHTISMPAASSSQRTQHNAHNLARLLGVTHKVTPIHNLADAMYSALGHDKSVQDTTFENVQARARTDLLFNYGNQHNAMVLGTGDLSEIALGWCTFNGDHMSHYHVNSSIPKTLVRHLVNYASNQLPPKTRNVLQDIITTPVSPELTGNGGKVVDQKTEDIIGPYELHDFFLYYVIRWGDAPMKISMLAKQAFEGVYSDREIDHWLRIFLQRFTQNQFKRNVMPDGPKVGSIALSPRGDWRMPPDMFNTAIWTNITIKE